MQELGSILIKVAKDESNHYSFDVQNDNEDLCCVADVLEDTLKKY